MLFLGNEKYKEEDEYQNFVQSHGGSTNAFTTFEETNYYFDVSFEHLEPTLDRFAQFFICPTFNESAAAREMNAVDSGTLFILRKKINLRENLKLFIFQKHSTWELIFFSEFQKNKTQDNWRLSHFTQSIVNPKHVKKIQLEKFLIFKEHLFFSSF